MDVQVWKIQFGVLRLARRLLECQQTLSRHSDGAAIRLVLLDPVDGRVLGGKTLAEMGGPPHQPNTLGRLVAWRKAKGISIPRV